MRKLCKETVKMTVAVLLGMVWLWFALSFAWSLDDMPLAELLAGVAYCVAVVPIYEGIKKVLRLS